MANIFREFFSEKDAQGRLTGSSKRWIAITTSAVLSWGIAYAVSKANNASERLAVIVATMTFIGVLVGVATVPQIVSLFRGGTVPDNTKPDEK